MLTHTWKLSEATRQTLFLVGATLALIVLLSSFLLFVCSVWIRVTIDERMLLIETYNSDILPFIFVFVGIINLFQSGACVYVLLKLMTVENREKYLRSAWFILVGGIVLVLFELLSAIVSFVHISVLEQEFSEGLQRGMRDYSKGGELKQEMDRVQILYECCGDVDYTDWFLYPWVLSSVEDLNEASSKVVSKKYLQPSGQYLSDDTPFSCCDPRSPRPCIHHHIHDNDRHHNYNHLEETTLYVIGCRHKLMEVYYKILLTVGLIAMAIACCKTVVLMLVRALQTSLQEAQRKGDWEATTHTYIYIKPKEALEEEELLDGKEKGEEEEELMGGEEMEGEDGEGGEGEEEEGEGEEGEGDDEDEDRGEDREEEEAGDLYNREGDEDEDDYDYDREREENAEVQYSDDKEDHERRESDFYDDRRSPWRRTTEGSSRFVARRKSSMSDGRDRELQTDDDNDEYSRRYSNRFSRASKRYSRQQADYYSDDDDYSSKHYRETKQDKIKSSISVSAGPRRVRILDKLKERISEVTGKGRRIHKGQFSSNYKYVPLETLEEEPGETLNESTKEEKKEKKSEKLNFKRVEAFGVSKREKSITNQGGESTTTNQPLAKIKDESHPKAQSPSGSLLRSRHTRKNAPMKINPGSMKSDTAIPYTSLGLFNFGAPVQPQNQNFVVNSASMEASTEPIALGLGDTSIKSGGKRENNPRSPYISGTNIRKIKRKKEKVLFGRTSRETTDAERLNTSMDMQSQTKMEHQDGDTHEGSVTKTDSQRSTNRSQRDKTELTATSKPQTVFPVSSSGFITQNLSSTGSRNFNNNTGLQCVNFRLDPFSCSPEARYGQNLTNQSSNNSTTYRQSTETQGWMDKEQTPRHGFTDFEEQWCGSSSRGAKMYQDCDLIPTNLRQNVSRLSLGFGGTRMATPAENLKTESYELVEMDVNTNNIKETDLQREYNFQISRKDEDDVIIDMDIPDPHYSSKQSLPVYQDTTSKQTYQQTHKESYELSNRRTDQQPAPQRHHPYRQKSPFQHTSNVATGNSSQSSGDGSCAASPPTDREWGPIFTSTPTKSSDVFTGSHTQCPPLVNTHRPESPMFFELATFGFGSCQTTDASEQSAPGHDPSTSGNTKRRHKEQKPDLRPLSPFY